MKNDWKFQRKPQTDDDQKKLIGALAIPLIVIILILVIVVADRCGRKGPDEQSSEVVTTAADTMAATQAPETESSSATEATDAMEATEATEATDAFEAENFKRDSIPEILELMKKYFNARAVADAVTMNQLYGIGEDEVSVTALEAQKTRMRSNAKYVTGFDHIATYVKPGKTSDSWLVYTTAEIQFRSVKNTAPMIMWCYVTKDAEGNYLLSDNSSLPADVLDYVDAAGRSEEVRKLAADVNARLKAALTEDSDLQQVYGILNSDSPLWVDDEETSPEVVILGDETSAEESTDGTDEAESGRNADEATDATDAGAAGETAEAEVGAAGAAAETSAAAQ